VITPFTGLDRRAEAFMHSIFAISSTIRKTETPDGAVLLDVERGEIFSVNVIGSKILELLHVGLDETAIASQLSSIFGVDPEQVRTDVHEFLETLHRRHILSKGPGGHK
jgi:hypothetical protein